jgi:hypothetical protein
VNTKHFVRKNLPWFGAAFWAVLVWLVMGVLSPAFSQSGSPQDYASQLDRLASDLGRLEAGQQEIMKNQEGMLEHIRVLKIRVRRHGGGRAP